MISLALNKIRPGAIWGLNGDVYEGLEWHDTIQSKPTKEEIDAAIILVEQELNAVKYKKLRQTEYPSILDFADAWVKNDQVALEDYRQKCLAVKAKYPKP